MAPRGGGSGSDAGVGTAQPEGIVALSFASEARPIGVRAGARVCVPVPKREPRRLSRGRTLVWGAFDRGPRIPLLAVGPEGADCAYPWSLWRRYVLNEQYAKWRRRPLHTRVPIRYTVVPARARRAILRAVCAHRLGAERADFPQPPFDGGFEALSELVRRHAPAPPRPRPVPRVCLTHDIDTAAGFAFVRGIAELELSVGVRSSWNILAGRYAIDHGVLEWLAERGFEIGLHGYNHDNRLSYLPERQLRRRLERCRALVSRYAIRGFRSPSWLRSGRLMRVLADYVRYDSSCLDFDWLCPAGRGGVLTASPFRVGRLVEIPTTLPFEAPVCAGADPSDAPVYWQRKIEWLVEVGGQAVAVTHPDPHYSGNQPMLKAYACFLDRLLSAFGGRWTLPKDLAGETWDHA
jgi:peptidoglycan/xylan/chitin deacetylase (PgdA/CDA1 family)